MGTATRPVRGLGANEQMMHTACPACGEACTMWIWLEQVKHIEKDGTAVHRVKTTGTLTDLVHDDARAAMACPGVR